MNEATGGESTEPSQEKSDLTKRRFKKRWIVWLVLLLVFGPYLFFRATSFSRKIVVVETPAVAKSLQFDGSLRVMTWNIAHGRGATDSNWEEGGGAKEGRVAEIAALIQQVDADIVVLNEVDFSATWSGGHDQGTAIAKSAGYPYFVKQSNLDFGLIYGRWYFGNVVLSRFPITEADVIELAPVNQWEDWVVGCKRGMACTIELAPENSISFIGVHMESRSESVRVEQAYDLTMKCSELEYPIFLAGDLNTTPDFAPFSNVNKNGENAFQELVKPTATGLSYSPSVEPTAAESTFPSDKPKSVIDWILYEDDSYQLVSQKVIQSLLSDHLPVVAEFQEK